MDIAAAASEKKEVFEEETHLELVDLLSNVPLRQPDVLEEEAQEHVDDERIGEDNDDDEDQDSSDKFEAVLSHDLAQQHRLEEDILEPNEEEVEESCPVAEASKQLESEDHKVVEPLEDDDDEDSYDKFEAVSKQGHQLEIDNNKLRELSEPEVEESCQVAESLTHLESEPHPVHHLEQHVEDDEEEDKEPNQSDEEDREDREQKVQQKEDLLSDEVLLESEHDLARSEVHLQQEALQSRISPTQHSEHDEDFDKLSEQSSINDEPKDIIDEEEEEEPLPSLMSSEKLVSHEESLEEGKDDDDYLAEKTAYHHPPTSSKDFLSDFDPVLFDTRLRGKLEKVFDPNETVEENSSFEDEIPGHNKLIGSDKPQNSSSEDVPEFSPIRSDPPESFSSSKSKDLFEDDDNSRPTFQMKPNKDKFNAKEEARHDSVGSESFGAEPEQLLAFDSPTSPSSLASPFQSDFRAEKFPSEKLEFVSELSSFDSGPISDKLFEPNVQPLTSDTKSFGTKDVEEKLIPSSFDARPLDVRHHQQQPMSHEVDIFTKTSFKA